MTTITWMATALVLSVCAWAVLRSKNMHIWIGAYMAQTGRRWWPRRTDHVHVYFCFCDHFEPYWNKADCATARRRADRWLREYPRVAHTHRDSDGRAPQHTFFYPEEEYDAEILDGLANLRREGYGDVEVHLHHDNDTPENLQGKLVRYTELLNERHGLLRCDPQTGKVLYCFIHGNWALDNSRPDGRWCGVDNELSVLVETGCRCDFTMPSAPSDTQTRKINSIYAAKGVAGRRKSHNHGRDCEVGNWLRSGELLLVQGPLTLNWRERKGGLLPRIESGEVSADAPPNAARVRRWERCRIGIRGAENHVFIKVHTHGAEERTAAMLLDGGFETLWTELERQFRDRPGYSLHYVSAWQLYETVLRICRGKERG